MSARSWTRALQTPSPFPEETRRSDCGFTCAACPRGSDDPGTTRLLTRRVMTAFFNVLLKDQPEHRYSLLGEGMEREVEAGLVRAASTEGF